MASEFHPIGAHIVRPRADIGDYAVATFANAVGSEEWWLGDLALVLQRGRTASVIAPNADGVLLTVSFYGDDASAAAAVAGDLFRRWVRTLP